MHFFASLLLTLSIDGTVAARAFVVERFEVAAGIPVDFAVALEPEILRELNRLPGCESALRAAAVVKTALPRPAIVISGEIVAVRGAKPFLKGAAGMAAKVRFRDFDSGDLLHEETIQSDRSAMWVSSGEMEMVTRGLAKRLAAVARSRFLR